MTWLPHQQTNHGNDHPALKVFSITYVLFFIDKLIGSRVEGYRTEMMKIVCWWYLMKNLAIE